MKTRSIDMTEGNILKLLLLFSIPLLLGNLFQELYNVVDSVVVGNFVGKQALAAMGSTTSICNTLVRFFNGISIGAGVVVSQRFGAKDNEGLHKAVETTMLTAVITGIVVSLCAIPFVPFMLEAISTPEDVMEPSSVYMRIYILGVLFLFIYNMGSSILRAVGDTKRPLYFLIATTVVNIVLDLLFVAVFHWGIAGAAWATIIAEAVSAVLVLQELTKTKDVYRLTIKDLAIDKDTLKKVCIIGLPAGIQQALTSFSNAFVQRYINQFDSSVMAGWSCHLKLDSFTLLPVLSIGQAVTSFTGQNLGAKNLKRAKEGTRTGAVLGVILLLTLSAIMYLGAPIVVGLFSQDPDVLHYGTLFVRLMCPFRFFSALTQTYAGALRGAGDAKGPMIIMMTSFIAIRQIYLFIITRIYRSVTTVGLGYPVGWICCGILITIYYFRSGWEKQYEKAD